MMLRYHIALIMDLAGEEYHHLAATSPDRVKRHVPTLAGLVQRYAQEALQGDPRVFEQLRELRIRRTSEFADEVKSRQVRPKAHAAFREKDYEEAARLYESIRVSLSPVEACRPRATSSRMNRRALSRSCA